MVKDRIEIIISYKTCGSRSEFAKIMEWSEQYLSKLLRGENIGLKPLMSLLEKLPEIDARWLMTGQGEMFDRHVISDLQQAAFNTYTRIAELGKYLPVMSPKEITAYVELVNGTKASVFSDKTVARWKEALEKKSDALNAAIDVENIKTQRKCKIRKAL